MPVREPGGPIQVPLPGLLSLLQLKNDGRNPFGLVDTLQSVAEILRWYAHAQAVQVLTSDVLITGIGGVGAPVPSGQVGNNEWWMLHHFSVSMNGILAAGQELSIATMIEYGITAGGGGIGVATSQMSRVFVQNENPHVCSDIPGGYILMPPASQLYVTTSRVTLPGAGIPVNCRARYTRMPI